MLVTPNTEIASACWRLGNTLSRMTWPSGTSAAPPPPCTIRHSTRLSSEAARPQKSVPVVKVAMLQIITLREPKRATSQPVSGVQMAVARILKVTVQAISSCVADMVPCICGCRPAATRIVAL